MKWIGQKIWCWITRFKNDVYLESPTAGGSDPDKFLGIDSDGKIIYRTGAEVLSDIGAGEGDITGVTLTADDTNTASDTAGSADFTIAGGEGIDTRASGTTVTISGEEATTSNKGVASFNSNQFSVSSGATSLASTISIGADDDSLVTIKRLAHGDDDGGNLKIQAGDGGGTNKAGGNLNLFAGGGTGNATGGGINFISTAAGSSGSSANSFANIAELSSAGNLQLDGTLLIDGSTLNFDDVALTAIQTSAESFVDNDTSIMTSASIQDKIQAHYHYQYISFLGNATVPSDGDWMTCSANGISNHTWNTNLGSGGTTVGSSTATIPVGAIGAGIRIPYAAVLVGFTGITNRASNHQSAVGLLLGEPTWNDYATFDCTLRAYHAADISAGPDTNYSSRPVKSEDLSRSQAISAGQVIYPVVKSIDSNASVCKISMTIVIKTLIP